MTNNFSYAMRSKLTRIEEKNYSSKMTFCIVQRLGRQMWIQDFKATDKQ